MSIENIEHLSERLRDLYVSLRRMGKRYYRPKLGDDKYWKQLARLVLSHDLDGAHYIKWIWDFYSVTRKIAPWPSVVTSPKSLNIYLQNASYKPKDRARRLQVKLDVQFEITRQRLMLGETLKSILEDESLEIGPVVRYVLAHHGGLTDLACGFRAEAEREVGFEPFYKKLLGDKLPL